MSVYFLRHVKTVNNHLGFISGRMDSPILSVDTIDMPQGINSFNKVFVSTAKRCLDTLNLMSQYLYDSEIISTELLLERSLGIMEGMLRDEAIKKYPTFFIGNKLDINAELPNGESIIDVKKRLEPLVNLITPFKDSPQNCLVCSHNQVLKILYSLIHDIPITNDFWKIHNYRQRTAGMDIGLCTEQMEQHRLRL